MDGMIIKLEISHLMQSAIFLNYIEDLYKCYVKIDTIVLL